MTHQLKTGWSPVRTTPTGRNSLLSKVLWPKGKNLSQIIFPHLTFHPVFELGDLHHKLQMDENDQTAGSLYDYSLSK